MADQNREEGGGQHWLDALEVAEVAVKAAS